jgi:hypothetical protein
MIDAHGPRAATAARRLQPRMMKMDIALASRRLNGFKRWSKDHSPSCNDDDSPGGATPVTLAMPLPGPDADDDPAHRPWAIPGVGGAF